MMKEGGEKRKKERGLKRQEGRKKNENMSEEEREERESTRNCKSTAGKRKWCTSLTRRKRKVDISSTEVGMMLSLILFFKERGRDSFLPCPSSSSFLFLFCLLSLLRLSSYLSFVIKASFQYYLLPLFISVSDVYFGCCSSHLLLFISFSSNFSS